MKRAFYAIVVLFVCCFVGYRYVADSGLNALTVIESRWYVSGYSKGNPNKIPPTHQYDFSVENTSGRSIKLLGINLLDYKGVRVSDVSISGKPIDGLMIPSRSKISVDYDVVYENPPIHTPQMVSITYRSLGVTHVQQVTLYNDYHG